MRSDVGRYFEGRLLETIRLLRALYDVATGVGAEVEVGVEGRELVFRCASREGGRGFLRVTAKETSALVVFPDGRDLLDPERRLRGAYGRGRTLVVSSASEVDTYVRRLIEAAYGADPT